MKTSLYTSKYIDDRNKDYYIHNSLHGTTIRIFDNDLIDFAEKILRSKNEEIDENIITNKDFEGFYSTLKENKMVVESNINEKNIVNYRYQQFTDMDKTLGIIMTPTMACNFRCPYCYQDHEKLEMEDFIYEGTIKLILDTVKTKNMKNVIISWFGGEPTLKLDEIIKFMEELKEKLPDDVVLKGDMTTNGYLLNKINFKRLIDVNINHYQITVDGLKESHDSTRILANGNGTWDTIITNLLNMKNTDYTFTVTLRSNISKFYIEDIDEWCKFVFEKFGDDTRFITHMETVKNLGGDAAEFLFDHDNDPSDKIIFAQKNNKLNISETIYRDNFSMTCYASKNNNLCIYHNGNIVKCTVDFDDLDINIVGNILPNGEYSLKEENLSWWTNYELFDTCKECEIYPVCYGKKCPRSYFNPEACDIQKKIYYSSVVCV